MAQVPGLCVPPTFLTEESCKAPAILPAQARPLNIREFSSSVWYLRLEVWAPKGPLSVQTEYGVLADAGG